MATPDVRNVLRVPGYLVKDPTSLASAFPFGGTALGMTRAIEVRWTPRAKTIAAEEWGGTAVGQVYCGETVVLAAILRSWDSTAVASIFPAASGATVNYRVQTGGVRPGSVQTPHKLLFAPIALDYHPCVYFPAAVGLPDATAKLQLSLAEEIGLAGMWRALPADSSGSVYQIGTRGSISL